MTPEAAWTAIEAHFIGQPGVTRSAKKGFAEGGLMTSGKLFAIRRDKGMLTKLPTGQIQALIATGLGKAAIMGGRTMREWLWLQDEAADGWLSLAQQAEAFVREQAAG